MLAAPPSGLTSSSTGSTKKANYSTINLALVGNPNCGKSSLFNKLTGLRQRTGNFPGVTVERKSGKATFGAKQVEVIDLPGTYSLHPSSLDERVVLDALLGFYPGGAPDAILYVADANKLDKHLLLLTQVMDLGMPVILALNFVDELQKSGEKLDFEDLSKSLGVPVVGISARTGEGIETLRGQVAEILESRALPSQHFYSFSNEEKELTGNLAESMPDHLAYARLLVAHHGEDARVPAGIRIARAAAIDVPEFDSMRWQVRETMQRFDRFLPTLRAARKTDEAETVSDKIDKVVTHPVAGPVIFFAVLFLVFQAIFTWSSWPTELIENTFAFVGDTVRDVLPKGYLADFIVDGILAGLGGILVFVPQIAILFFLLTLLEEAGYMARAVYLFDRLMQRFGLNGRSLVALTSSGACAIPAIMSTRTISNPKERLITILVSPLISCSARIPVYTILIGFAVPAVTVWGVFNSQALAFMGIYLISILSALVSALVFKYILKSTEQSYLMIELPQYRVPVWRNVFINVYTKTKAFVFGAGKIIIGISMVLWFLASFGPGDSMELAEAGALRMQAERQLDDAETADFIANARLEASYAGRIGKAIEPAIEPLGYDWRIGIALVTSFAAREVFVGTIATLYAIGSADENETVITERLNEARRPDGSKVYTMATAVSLILFYLFAMQCMSTLAVTKRETGTWKWPIVQTVYMTGLAYFAAFAAYQLLS